MSTADKPQTGQPQTAPVPDARAGHLIPLREDNELACSPWLGLHYRAEEG